MPSKPFRKRSYMSEFSRNEFWNLYFVNLHQWKGKLKPRFGMSVFDEIADVVRVFESLWCIVTQIATWSSLEPITLELSHQEKDGQLTEITMNLLSKNDFLSVGCVENQHALFRDRNRFTCMSFRGGPPCSLFSFDSGRSQSFAYCRGVLRPTNVNGKCSKQLEAKCMWRCLHARRPVLPLQDPQWSTRSIVVHQCSNLLDLIIDTYISYIRQGERRHGLTSNTTQKRACSHLKTSFARPRCQRGAIKSNRSTKLSSTSRRWSDVTGTSEILYFLN